MKQARLPARSGVGFKPEHFSAVIAGPQPVGFFEVHAENYMGAGGPPHAHLTKLREDYALSIHGVGLSIGSMHPLDKAHLVRLGRSATDTSLRVFPNTSPGRATTRFFSMISCRYPTRKRPWPGSVSMSMRFRARSRRQMLLENPATYLLFAESTIPETDFLGEIAWRTGCGLLLDVNNVFVASTNHGVDPHTYLSAFPFDRVGEIHLGGHTATVDETGAALLIDTHDRPVADPVWSLYTDVVGTIGAVATLIEWDGDIPAWPVLRREAELAQEILDRNLGRRAA